MSTSPCAPDLISDIFTFFLFLLIPFCCSRIVAVCCLLELCGRFMSEIWESDFATWCEIFLCSLALLGSSLSNSNNLNIPSLSHIEKYQISMEFLVPRRRLNEWNFGVHRRLRGVPAHRHTWSSDMLGVWQTTSTSIMSCEQRKGVLREFSSLLVSRYRRRHTMDHVPRHNRQNIPFSWRIKRIKHSIFRGSYFVFWSHRHQHKFFHWNQPKREREKLEKRKKIESGKIFFIICLFWHIIYIYMW